MCIAVSMLWLLTPRKTAFYVGFAIYRVTYNRRVLLWRPRSSNSRRMRISTFPCGNRSLDHVLRPSITDLLSTGVIPAGRRWFCAFHVTEYWPQRLSSPIWFIMRHSLTRSRCRVLTICNSLYCQVINSGAEQVSTRLLATVSACCASLLERFSCWPITYILRQAILFWHMGCSAWREVVSQRNAQ